MRETDHGEIIQVGGRVDPYIVKLVLRLTSLVMIVGGVLFALTKLIEDLKELDSFDLALIALLMVGLFAAGIYVAWKIAGHVLTVVVARMSAPVAPPMLYQQDNYLNPVGSDDLMPIDERVMVRQSKIDTAAAKTIRYLYPHTQPTRASIQRVTGSDSNSFATSVQDRLVAIGRARSDGQGKSVQWVTGDDDE